MPLIPVSATRSHELAKQGASLIDIREPAEFASQSIPGSRNMPLSSLASARLDVQGEKVIFLCRSGARTMVNDAALSKLGGPGAQVMQGGLSSWANSGLPTESSTPRRKSFFGLFG